MSLRSPVDGLIYGQHGVLLPRSTLVSWWEPGQIIAETIPVTTTPELPVGAYHVMLDVYTPDRGNRAAPAPRRRYRRPRPKLRWVTSRVPGKAIWQTPRRNADFGEQIQLVGFDAPDSSSRRADTLDVTLYWKALQAPGEDYTVFVHLLDADGQLVSSHDGQPMAGTLSNRRLASRRHVPDTHALSIDSELPAGTYQLNVGMYRRPSLERLIVRDADGNEMPDRVFFLRTVTVP